MKRFSRIVEEYQFSGRDTNMLGVINSIIGSIESSYEEKKDFYNQYLPEDISTKCGDEASDRYIDDLSDGEMKKFYKQDEVVNYEELRQYLYDTYEFDLDQDTDGIYVDCIWLKYLISSMTTRAVKNINT